MKITDYPVSPSLSDNLKGKITVLQEFNYEVFGPFGQGYNIKVSRSLSVATLAYCWRDGGGAMVKTPSGSYEISESSIFQKRKKMLEMDSQEEFLPLEDDFVMALFVINNFYWTRSGPFKNK